MATIDTSTDYTLLDLVRGHDPNGNTARIINTLWSVGDLIKDFRWYEANDFTSHTITQSLTEPAGKFGIITAGIEYSPAKTKQVVEGLAMLETYSRIDERLLRRMRDPEQFRA